MTDKETIIEFVENYESNLDGFENADDIICGFFNERSESDEDGDVWLYSQGNWASDQQLEDLVTWLRANGHC